MTQNMLRPQGHRGLRLSARTSIQNSRLPRKGILDPPGPFFQEAFYGGGNTDDLGSFLKSDLATSTTTSPKTSASFVSSSLTTDDQSFFVVPFGQVDT